jgi:Domain of unknown function (DUF4190)
MTEPPESSSKPGTPAGAPQDPPPATPYQGGPAGYPPPGQSYPPPSYPSPSYPSQSYPPPEPGSYPPPQYPPPSGPYAGGYPPPPPQPYGPYSPPPAAPKNGIGIAALVVALLSLPAVLTVVGGFILGLVAIVLGFLGYSRVKKGEANNGGIAIAGIVLGLVGIVLNAALIAFGVWGFMKVGGGDYFDCMEQAGVDRSAQLQCEEEFRGNIENRFSVTLTPTP